MTTKTNDSAQDAPSTATGSQNAGHTPGPWTEIDGHFRGADGKPLIQGRTVAEIKANRRLIGSAPELLAALEGLLVAIRCGQHEDRLNKSNPLCVEAARATIARATGAQP